MIVFYTTTVDVTGEIGKKVERKLPLVMVEVLAHVSNRHASLVNGSDRDYLDGLSK